MLWSKGTIRAEKKFRPWLAFDGLEAAGGSWGARHRQGPPGINAVVKRNRLSQKKFGLGWPLMASRPLEGPGGARHHQGPPGINAVVKRNRLSQKKKFGLGWPLMASRPQEGPRGQSPSGTTRDQCCGQKEPFETKKKFPPRPAFDGLEAAGGFWGGRTPSGTIRD